MFSLTKKYHNWKTRRENARKKADLQKLHEAKKRADLQKLVDLLDLRESRKWAYLQKLADLQGWADLKLWSKLTRNDPFTLVNEARISNRLPPLIYDSRLADLADEHCFNMARSNHMSHDGFNLRFKQSGYRTGGENVAMGHRSARGLVNGWLSSPCHRANIMNPQFTHTGLANKGGYACQIFGG